LEYGKELSRDWHSGSRARLDFETDAEDGYFERDDDPGVLQVSTAINGRPTTLNWANTLYGGAGHLSLELTKDARVGDIVSVTVSVADSSRVEPFISRVMLTVQPPQKTTSGVSKPRTPQGGEGEPRPQPAGIDFDVHAVRRAEWEKHDMDEFAAVRAVRQDAGGPFTFFVNMDNQFLQYENKNNPNATELNEAKFSAGLVLIALGAVRQREANVQRSHGIELETSNDIQVEDLVAFASDAIAPMLLPAIESLSGIDPELVLPGEESAATSDED